ncbi:MAG: hypothetical protein K2X49_27750 [Acetobacteraceae bacterium]|nr:hypothetical protein [Acetobacteraceae bacterium]
MSNAKDPTATPPPPPATPGRDAAGPPASTGSPPGGLRLDPAVVMLGLGAVVLVVALWVLWTTPRADSGLADNGRLDRIEQRLGALEPLREQAGAATARLQGLTALEQRVGQLAELEGRLRAVETRPVPQAPDLRPLQGETAALAQRLAAVEQEARRAAAINPDQFASRAALEALAARVQGAEAGGQRIAAVEQQLGQRITALEQGLAQRSAALEQRIDERGAVLEQRIAQRTAALEQQMTQRTTALEQQAAQRGTALEQQLAQTRATLEQQMTQRITALEQQVAQRGTALEQQLAQARGALEQQIAQARTGLEGAQQRLAALDQRTARLGAIEALQAALAAGQPLGTALDGLPSPPAALARFAAAAPPTEAGLRLGFEDAAKAARAAADPAQGAEPGRAGIADAALSRLGALVTVRRGEQVIWGDAAEADIEKARRALVAGDLALAMQHIGRLPPAARQAMSDWTAQAEALLAARAALRQMLAAG